MRNAIAIPPRRFAADSNYSEPTKPCGRREAIEKDGRNSKPPISAAGLVQTESRYPQPPSVQEGRLRVPWGKLFNKNVSVRMGRDDDKRWIMKLRDMIITGAAKLSQIISHRLPLDEAPETYAKFDAREDGSLRPACADALQAAAYPLVPIARA